MVANPEGAWLVLVNRRRRHYARDWIISRVERCGIDERFEDRAGLTRRVRDLIELALRVAAPSDHSDYLARVRVHGNERGLQSAGRNILLRVELVQIVQLLCHGSVG